MFRHELAVQQTIAANPQAGDEPRQRNLRRIRPEREHALAKECGTERYSVEAPDELSVLPRFDGMGMTEAMETNVGGFDVAVDPGLFPVGAETDDGREVPVACDGEAA